MTNKIEDKNLLNDEIHREIKKIEDLNRLSSLERIQMTFLVMLLGFVFTIIVMSFESNTNMITILIFLILILASVFIYHVIAIYFNSIEKRIEAFGVSSFFIFWIFIILTCFTLILALRVNLSELSIIIIAIIAGFAVGVFFHFFKIDNKISSWIYNELKILHEEVEEDRNARKKSLREKEINRLIWNLTIVGVLIPTITFYFLHALGVEQELLMAYLLI